MLTRRELLRLFAVAPAAGTSLPLRRTNAANLDRREHFISNAEKLLHAWCAGMLARQIDEPSDLTRHGGLWSSGDNRILGRCGDAVYPFLWCANAHQDERFLNAAIRVVQWSFNNVVLPDGAWKNEVDDKWLGITVFSATALAQALQHYGDLISAEHKTAWYQQLEKSAQWLYDTIDINFGNINYPIANAYAMALLGRLLNEPKYLQRGRELAYQARAWFTQKDGLLYGEGRRKNGNNRSAKGCYPIDLAYNVEESLPLLVQYALLEKDNDLIEHLVTALRVHLEFMLPDGGWDNSWGTRNFKWTWWGSRTSDGCQPAYGLLADHDPRFLEVAARNTSLLKRCTYGGVLHGGPHLASSNYEPSLHHTFCHARAFASLLDGDIPTPSGTLSTELPRDRAYGVRNFDDIATTLVATGPWRATFTAYDFPYRNFAGTHPSGGALSVLFHSTIGPMLAASMTQFRHIERTDMPAQDGPGFGVLTPRLELEPHYTALQRLKDFVKRRKPRRNVFLDILDQTAKITSATADEQSSVTSRARFTNTRGELFLPAEISALIDYSFSNTTLDIELTVDNVPENATLQYVLPLICTPNDSWQRMSKKRLALVKENGEILVEGSHELVTPPTKDGLIFNHVPGFFALPVVVSFQHRTTIKLRV